MIEDDFDIKKKVEEVLNDSGFAEQRAAKMGVDELLKYVLLEPITLVYLTISLQAVICFPRCRHSLCMKINGCFGASRHPQK